MKKIFKYHLPIQQWQGVQMPRDAVILTVQPQDNQLMIWAIVNPENELQERKFAVFVTGQTIGSLINLNYLATCVTHSGQYVFHVFEKLFLEKDELV